MKQIMKEYAGNGEIGTKGRSHKVTSTLSKIFIRRINLLIGVITYYSIEPIFCDLSNVDTTHIRHYSTVSQITIT
jgi:hypothetical protein